MSWDLFIIALIIHLVFFFYLLVRCSMVSNFRQEMIDRVYEAAIADVLDGKGYQAWRFDEYYGVSYDRMVWQLWKPVGSFYPKDPSRKDR